jgi:hypothetical protein
VRKYSATHTRHIPPLDEASTFSEKCLKLRIAFFPDPEAIPAYHLSGIISTRDLSEEFSPVTRSEISAIFSKTNPQSACGNDKLNYLALRHLKSAAPLVLPLLATSLLKLVIHYSQ